MTNVGFSPIKQFIRSESYSTLRKNPKLEAILEKLDLKIFS